MPNLGGTAGKGRGEIVACRASWRVVFCDRRIQATLDQRMEARARATRLPCHPTQAWAMEGAGSAETADPTGAARVATLRCPRPPRPPVRRFRSPLETGSRPPTHPPPAAHPRRFPHRSTAPATRLHIFLVWEAKTRRPRLRQPQAVYCPPNRGRSKTPLRLMQPPGLRQIHVVSPRLTLAYSTARATCPSGD
jgi:hypothetical protein